MMLILSAVLAAAAAAKVTPVIWDRPLEQLPDPTPAGPLAPVPSRQVDDWLNLRINSDTTGQVQNEQQVVAHPAFPGNVVAVWRDFRLGYRRVGVGRSFDGGLTWTDELFPPAQYAMMSDPALTWHPSGAIYACVLSYNNYNEDGLFVARSTDGGVNWDPFVPAVNAVPDAFEDKELIACDRTGGLYDGNLYVAWARFTNNVTVSRIHVVRSTNGGVSWDAPVQVSDTTSVQWAVPAVGPDGQVYVGWVRYNPPGIYLDRSLDGGVTWRQDRLVQTTAFAQAYINPQLAMFNFPALDVDITAGPRRGYLYIAFTDDLYGDTDLFFTRSTDGGTTWSPRVRINDDAVANGCDQFHPWLVCDEQGALHVTFYDRRNDPGQNLLMDLYYAYSTDGGENWSVNERITTVASNPANDSLDSGLIGEYNGLAVRDGVIYPVWTDTRNGHQDTYTAVLDTASGVPALKPLLPGARELSAAPNPFNGEVRLSLDLAQAGDIRMAVYTVRGERLEVLAEGRYPAGRVERFWRPQGASGLYLVQAVTPAGTAWSKVLYLK
ncbi:MAG: exo-alpha-sialidase [Candidatus Zixiibacteriota bacterium]|nr:MAG: exo-alpha-sialidase [candidate division Zixibacteria bacterium]